MKAIFFSFAVISLLLSCSPKTTPTVENIPSTPQFPSETIAAGYSLFHSDCVKCHKAKTITMFTRAQWDVILPKMAGKAKINSDQQANINSYINWELEK